MAKSDVIHARLDPILKANVEGILMQIGLTTSDAVNLFFKQVELNGGLPFELRIPNYNSETLAAIEEARRVAKDKNAATYTDMDSLRRAIEE
ncbi:MAG: type II toxin-antitoxin system RelB/DinJ family antitoxin [Clostridiales bacterium]|jgi:DNA-damage-inducible protein J|nr:type II toxin-antitoxin system RelB/DinJ family antitoxin [Clostridiales bacterium]